MATFTSQIAILFLLLLSATTIHGSISSNHAMVRCNEKDRGTLLVFKHGIIRSFNQLSTWSTEENCCAWEGVHCDNMTGSVTKLDLQNQVLKGEINLSILELEFLNYLDLSLNEFNAISTPPIRHNVTTVSNLHYLDLSKNDDLHMDNLHWLSRLSSLKYLDLSHIDLHKESDWLQLVAMLPSLLELHLNGCNLNYIMVSSYLKHVNFTSLVTLELVDNNFKELPKGLFDLTLTRDISYLDLSESNINGEIPSSLLNLRNLEKLYLRSNQLKGPIPDWIGQLEHLRYLDISYNMFNGSIPSTIGNLSSLVSLSIGSNYFSSEISKTTFSKLSNLDYLDMSNLTFQFDPEWVPPFQLSGLALSNTNQGPNFPSWIYTQKSLQVLDLSSSGILFADGNKFLSLVETISTYLFLSNNSMSEDISNVTLKASFIELDHNNFTGRPPRISPPATYVDLSYNSFSGSTPSSWQNLKDLFYINLWSNKLSGEVLGHLSDLKKLEFMNLGKNEFSGTIPINMPQNLEVIILRANQFEGNIPPQLFNQVSLFHLDLAHNKLSGSIPQCVYNMTRMMVTSNVDIVWADAAIDLYTKGQDYAYKVSPDRRTIDLSSNNLSGEVPLELFRLIQVQTLNLSYNNFSGIIPNQIGGMKNLESLDLSNNKFSGRIPQSMNLLNFLGYLNLSSNNFTGQIPIGTQLQSFNASSYTGNPELCGEPLKKCFTEEENPKNEEPSTRNEDGDPLRESLYLGMGVGFAVGFWGICGSLFLIRKWRHTFFRFFDRLTDWLYVALMMKLNSFGKTGPPAS